MPCSCVVVHSSYTLSVPTIHSDKHIVYIDYMTYTFVHISKYISYPVLVWWYTAPIH